MQRVILHSVFLSAGLLATIGEADAGFVLYASNENLGNVVAFNQSGASSTIISSVPQASGIAFDPSGNIYVASVSSNAVLKYTSAGTLIGTFATTNVSDPQGIAVDPSGNVYVVNYANGGASTVNEYSVTGAYLKTLSTGGLDGGVMTDSNGDVFVSGSNTILKFSSSGSLLNTFTTTGHVGFEQAAMDSAGNIYVTSVSGAIEKFSSSGTDLGVFATGTGIGDYGLAYNATTGDLYQAGAYSTTVQVFNSSGTSIGTIASTTGVGFLAVAPAGVPEPSSLVLVTLGLAGAAASVRRRRRDRAATPSD